MRTFRGGLLIGLAVAVLVGAAAIAYERYDTRTLKRTIRRGEVFCGVNADVSDLYERVPVGTKVVVRQKPEL